MHATPAEVRRDPDGLIEDGVLDVAALERIAARLAD
jgi:hypothetical protein